MVSPVAIPRLRMAPETLVSLVAIPRLHMAQETMGSIVALAISLDRCPIIVTMLRRVASNPWQSRWIDVQ